jgi:hypothetical protein
MNAIEISLTRKLRQLIDLQEVELSEAEAELYGVDYADNFADEYFNKKGELIYE